MAFTAWQISQTGNPSKNKHSFEVSITSSKLLGQKVNYQLTYTFFSRQQSGKERWRYAEGSFNFGIEGDRNIPGGWKAMIKKWLGKTIYYQYCWKLIQQKNIQDGLNKFLLLMQREQDIEQQLKDIQLKIQVVGQAFSPNFNHKLTTVF